jgi:hypothetical protein
MKRCRQAGQRISMPVSTAIRRRRTSARLGCGGGPGWSGQSAPPFFPEPSLLQESESHGRQQDVMPQGAPTATLEMVEPKLFLELLVRLLADPSRLDALRQLLERRVGGQVGEVVLALTAGAVLADQPHLVAGQMEAIADGGAVGRPHPQRGELGPQRALGAATPGDRPPGGAGQHRLGLDRGCRRHRMLAGTTGGPLGPRQHHRGRVDAELPRDPRGPGQAARSGRAGTRR